MERRMGTNSAQGGIGPDRDSLLKRVGRLPRTQRGGLDPAPVVVVPRRRQIAGFGNRRRRSTSRQPRSRFRRFSHIAALDRLGIRASEDIFELGATPALRSGHGTLAPQRAVGEVVEEPAPGTGGEIGVEGKELGVLEGLEAIDDEGFGHGEAAEQIATAEPVGGGEGGGAEAATAGSAAEVLEATPIGWSNVVAVTDKVPVGLGVGCAVREAGLEIWLVSQSYLPYYGGITEHVWHVAERLSARGHRVSILTGRPLVDGRPSRDADPPGVSVHRIGRTLRLPSNGARACVTIGWGWREQLAEMRLAPPDIVHIHSPLEPLLPLWALRELPGVKIGTFHTGGSRRHWGYRRFAARLAPPLRMLRVRLAVSREAARYVGEHFPGEYRVVPNGVDLTRFSPRAAAPEGTQRADLRVLFVGRCDPRKGLGTLLDALALVQRGGTDTRTSGRLRLRIVGDGPERRALERRARVADLPIEFTGSVARAELPRHYREADLFVAPSTDGESFGVSLLEALASGLPVIATRIPGYAETLGESGAALLIEPKSCRALGAALTALAEDPVRRERMGERGRTFVRRFDWDRLTGEVEGIYREALRASPWRGDVRPAGFTRAG